MKRPRIKRLFQFSLRTMLIVTVVLSVWLGMTVRKARQQKAAVAWVREVGGDALYDHQVASLAEFPDRQPNAWSDLFGPDYFEPIVLVTISHTAVSDISPLLGLPDLVWLDASHTRIDDLSLLAELPKLRILSLANTRVRDLSPLTGVMTLEHLQLTAARFSEEEIAKLQMALPNCKINYDPAG